MVNKLDAARVLINTLDALEREMLAADDEEVLAAAVELGLKPDMKGSIALAGVTQLVLRKLVARGKPDAPPNSRRQRKPSPRPPKD